MYWITVIASTLVNLPIYDLLLFKIQVGVVKAIGQSQRDFHFDGKRVKKKTILKKKKRLSKKTALVNWKQWH